LGGGRGRGRREKVSMAIGMEGRRERAPVASPGIIMPEALGPGILVEFIAALAAADGKE
jgi:hypothetical protein